MVSRDLRQPYHQLVWPLEYYGGKGWFPNIFSDLVLTTA